MGKAHIIAAADIEQDWGRLYGGHFPVRPRQITQKATQVPVPCVVRNLLLGRPKCGGLRVTRLFLLWNVRSHC